MNARFDYLPLALVALLALVAWPLIGSSSTWLTLTVAIISFTRPSSFPMHG